MDSKKFLSRNDSSQEMKQPVAIIEMGSDLYLELQKHRALIPEPARRKDFAIGQRWYTAILQPQNFKYPTSDFIKVEDQKETWEKILVTEGSATYYAWRHIPTNIVFR
jgi:hypothetical protein